MTVELCSCGTPSVAHAAVLHERPTLDGCPWCEEKNGTGWCWRHWAEAHDYFDEER